MSATLHGKLSSFYNRCVRRMCRCVYWVTTRCQKIHSWELRKRLGLGSFDDYYVSRVLKWLGYVSTLPMHRLPRLLMNASCVGGGSLVIMGKYRTNFNRCLDAVGVTQATWMEEAADPIAWAKRVRVVSQPLYKRNGHFVKTVFPEKAPRRSVSPPAATPGMDVASTPPPKTPSPPHRDHWQDGGLRVGLVPFHPSMIINFGHNPQ